MLFSFSELFSENSGKDRDYVPSRSSSDVKEQILTEVEKSRKRVRKVRLWKRNVSKLRRDGGQEYVGRKHKIHYAKSIKAYERRCGYKCKTFFSDGKEN